MLRLRPAAFFPLRSCRKSTVSPRRARMPHASQGHQHPTRGGGSGGWPGGEAKCKAVQNFWDLKTCTRRPCYTGRANAPHSGQGKAGNAPLPSGALIKQGTQTTKGKGRSTQWKRDGLQWGSSSASRSWGASRRLQLRKQGGISFHQLGLQRAAVGRCLFSIRRQET